MKRCYIKNGLKVVAQGIVVLLLYVAFLVEVALTKCLARLGRYGLCGPARSILGRIVNTRENRKPKKVLDALWAFLKGQDNEYLAIYRRITEERFGVPSWAKRHHARIYAALIPDKKENLLRIANSLAGLTNDKLDEWLNETGEEVRVVSVTVENYTVEEVADLTGLSSKDIYSQFRQGKFPEAKITGSRLLIPYSDFVSLVKDTRAENYVNYLMECSEHKRKMALHKLGVLKIYNRLVQKYSNGYSSIAKAHSRACSVCGITLRTVERWQSRFSQYGLLGLIDSRGGSRKRKKP